VYIRSFIAAARTDRDWLRAWNEYRSEWETMQQYCTLRNSCRD
jgi:hypothetical protein